MSESQAFQKPLKDKERKKFHKQVFGRGALHKRRHKAGVGWNFQTDIVILLI
jgi:hypothetical protein